MIEDVGIDITIHRGRELLEGGNSLMGMTDHHVVDTAVLVPSARPDSPLVDMFGHVGKMGLCALATSRGTRLPISTRSAVPGDPRFTPGNDVADPIDQPPSITAGRVTGFTR